MAKTEANVIGLMEKLLKTYVTQEAYKLDSMKSLWDAFKVRTGKSLVISIERHRDLILELLELDKEPT